MVFGREGIIIRRVVLRTIAVVVAVVAVVTGNVIYCVLQSCHGLARRIAIE
jgi:hypothetical protein